MTKKDYSTWSKDELIKEIVQLENRKKYGLVWEDKLEDVVEKCKIELPVLEEVQGKEILKDRNSPFNLIIEGDNYHALSVLNYTHNGKIDVIYIDPPFNTGARDWKYNNDYVDINDQWRHSKWISFMRNRLTLTKHLLSKDGVMIIAIDDNELCSLGLLIDEIFPNKDRNTVVIVSNPHGVSRSGFSRCHEYALFLLNPGRIVNKKPVPEDSREINLRRSGNNSLREDSPTMFYPIFVDKKTNKIIGAGEVPKTHYHPPKRVIGKGELYEVWPIDNKGEEKNWYYSRKRVIENGNAELFCKWVKNQLHVYFHHSNNSEQTYKTVWVGSEYDAGAYGATIVKNIIGKDFPFPKSLYTVSDCLKAVISAKDATILDFFAGSGTTGQAVLELNKADNGSRKFILCTNNEDNKDEGIKIADDICYPRIEKVINGYKGILDGKQYEGFNSNLKYFRTSFVAADPNDKNKTILTNKATEMLCIKEDTFDEVDTNEKYKIFRNKNRYTGIVFDSQIIADFKKVIEKIPGNFSVYIFSLGGDMFEEEFEDIKQKVTLSPIPEAILRVYRRIFK